MFLEPVSKIEHIKQYLIYSVSKWLYPCQVLLTAIQVQNLY